MAHLSTIFECPAYKVVENPPLSWGENKGLIPIKHGLKLALLRDHPRHGTLVDTFRVGTVLGSAVENYEDPDAARAQNRRNGGDDHWINACGVSLTAHERPQEVLRQIKIGDRVVLEGRQYEIVQQPNQNLGLKELAE